MTNRGACVARTRKRRTDTQQPVERDENQPREIDLIFFEVVFVFLEFEFWYDKDSNREIDREREVASDRQRQVER